MKVRLWPHWASRYVPNLAFRVLKRVGIRDMNHFLAPWLACTFPCRRFADILTDARARLGGDVARHAFNAMDFHHLHLAGLPARPVRVFHPLPHHILIGQVEGVSQIQQIGDQSR